MSDGGIPRALVAILAAAGVVVIIGGLRDAADLIIPLVFSGFLSVLVWPVVRVLVDRGLPRLLAILLVLTLVTGLLLGGTAVIGDSVARFTAGIPEYQAPLEERLAEFEAVLSARAGERVSVELGSLLDPGSIFQAVRSGAGAVASLVSNVLLIVIATGFILLEATELSTKLKVVFGGHATWLEDAAHRVQRYLALKTVISFATGLILTGLTAALGLDFPVLWGILAFVLNFVPAIGSIIASVPPTLVALVAIGPGRALAVLAVYFAVNFALGNVLEPRIMGRRLGLSPFVVILSLVFWGYVWGPPGMLVGVPMTVIVKLVLESSPTTRWVAVLLGDADEAPVLAGEGLEGREETPAD
ncbi:MAG: AI-2E family transporter [Alphaproteobacteria bacterium]|nr:AI-2E family transporter [Alphaproteobacteria bacterium]